MSSGSAVPTTRGPMGRLSIIPGHQGGEGFAESGRRGKLTSLIRINSVLGNAACVCAFRKDPSSPIAISILVGPALLYPLDVNFHFRTVQPFETCHTTEERLPMLDS
ncbi:hypothetical protein LAZ67_5004052 [Cordylochernes scorpioides]|uniref:Uncharacterized protein n=1 Tax=Cordylochernes scorpioides TaxID=51811 RepID=A0ABY6KHQ3_9ARAC|nr:hypothetical protein LAZ67_5004052 [Cordylochernes scorpioides]